MKQARKRSLDVLTIGTAVRDTFVKSRHFEKQNVHAPDGFDVCFPLGAKIAVDELSFASGGGATNAAVTFAHFGFATGCAARVGKDSAGYDIVHELEKEGVDTRGFQIDPKETTAHSIILLSGSGSRAILTSRGAARHLQIKDIPFDALSPSWIYLTSLGGDLKSLKQIFDEAKKRGISIAWNPGNGELEYGFKTLLPLLMQTSVLILNREEAAVLADTSPRLLASILHTLGPQPRLALLVTDGQAGAYGHARGATWQVSTLKGKRVNTTGAGDAFGSGFVASIMKDGEIENALRVGALNAHGVVTHMGAKAGILAHAPKGRELAAFRVRPVSSL